MELRTIGMILICASTLWMFIRFFQVGLQRKYWVKKGVFRWHIIPGTILVWLSPYFVYCVWLNRIPNLWVATVMGVLALSVCLTGFRMLTLLNRKDTRMKRYFLMIFFVMSIFPLQALSGICLLQESALFIDLGRALALLGLIDISCVFVIIALALPSYFAPIINLEESHDDKAPLPPFSWRKVLELLHPKTDPSSRMYSAVGVSPFGRFLVWFFGDFVNIPVLVMGVIVSWQIMTLPVGVLTGAALRSTEFIVAINLFLIGPFFWSIFEMTLFSRGYLTKFESWFSIFFGVVAPSAAGYFVIPSWFHTDFVTGFFRFMFLRLPLS